MLEDSFIGLVDNYGLDR